MYKDKLKDLTLEQKIDLIMFDQVISLKGIPELDIPVFHTSDGPHGVRKLDYVESEDIIGGTVCFPTGSALGATWNRDIAFETGKAIAKDCIKNGISTILGPGVNMKRTPRCGRNFEYFSEDPCLSGVLGAGYVNGCQSMGVGTALKHYAANNQETDRNFINVEVDERTLREYYLKVFEYVISLSNPYSVMCAYNKINGYWCSENKKLLVDILRGDWGYDGLIMSDFFAVHNEQYAVKSGINLTMPKSAIMHQEIDKALKSGYITMEEIDKSVMYVLDFMDKISNPKTKEYNRDAQHKVAYDCACEAITLLKNENNVLPVTSKKYKNVAVIGDYAKNPLFMGGGSSKVSVQDENVDIPFDCLVNKGEGIHFEYIPFSKDARGFFDENAMHAVNSLDSMEGVDGYDAAIVFVGDNVINDCETESFDRNNIHFTNFIDAVINATCAKFENTIVVIQSGSAMIPFRWQNKAKAIIQMWMTGEAAGSAIADILLGNVNPSGKLSETFMLRERDDIDLGDGKKVVYKEKMFVGYRYYDLHKDDVWYPFGHGISYTQFKYNNLEIKDLGGFKYKVTVDVSNIGDMDGKEVVQVYVGANDSIVDRPIKELKAFDKKLIKKDETIKFEFELNYKDFAYYNTNISDWMAEDGSYTIYIGASSSDIRLKDNIVLSDAERR